MQYRYMTAVVYADSTNVFVTVYIDEKSIHEPPSASINKFSMRFVFFVRNLFIQICKHGFPVINFDFFGKGEFTI